MTRTTLERRPPKETWSAWVGELLRRLEWTNKDLATASGTSPSAIGSWLRAAVVPQPAQIRAVIEVPEVADMFTIVDAYMAADILRPGDLTSRAPNPSTRTPLGEYSDAELARELSTRFEQREKLKPEA